MNSLIKNIFEEEKKNIGKSKEKVQCPHNLAIKNGLNEATLLK